MRAYINFYWALTEEPSLLLVDEGKVVYRGREQGFEADEIIDLREGWMLPPLIDSHCHVLNSGLDLTRPSLVEARSREDVLDAVSTHHRAQQEGWLVMVQYDQNHWGGPHITRAELDSISSVRPIVLRHANGHAGCANSAALAAAGIIDSTPDPAGGSFGRAADGGLDGSLFESGLWKVWSKIPKPNLEEMVVAILAAGESMHAYGIGCAHDMLTGAYDLDLELQAYQIAAERGNSIDVRLYIDAEKITPENADRLKGIASSQVRVAGVKLFADGAISSATAAIYGSYRTAQAGKKMSGELIYSRDELIRHIAIAEEFGFDVSIHSIGDHATDVVLDAFAALPHSGHRRRIEHAMLLSDDQIARISKLGIHVCAQPEFLARFAEAYNLQLGPERMRTIKPLKSLLHAGVLLALSSDRPIVTGNPWLGIRTAAKRPPGFDVNENIDVSEALNGYLARGAEIAGDHRMDALLKPGAPARALVLAEPPESILEKDPEFSWLT